MNQYLQNSSAAIASSVRTEVAKKVLKSDLSYSNSAYNGVSTGNSICYKCWKNTFPSNIALLQLRLYDKEKTKKPYNLMYR